MLWPLYDIQIFQGIREEETIFTITTILDCVCGPLRSTLLGSNAGMQGHRGDDGGLVAGSRITQTTALSVRHSNGGGSK